jgi:hypothetical protein
MGRVAARQKPVAVLLLPILAVLVCLLENKHKALEVYLQMSLLPALLATHHSLPQNAPRSSRLRTM